MSECPTGCWLGLGGNVDRPRAHIESALNELAALDSTELCAVSPLYRSAPMGPPDQPDFINAAAHLQSALDPFELLDAMQRIENEHGRIRAGERWGPRPLDLDLLLYGERRIESARLRVPHPGLADRAFVLYPLFDIAPADLTVPGLGSLGDLIARVDGASVEKCSERGND
jgi:2-amino-4-hydroxy-6-hydroxymethyldihydropteridine diphosphokinase